MIGPFIQQQLADIHDRCDNPVSPANLDADRAKGSPVFHDTAFAEAS
jgi:hypothetical protein